MNENIITVYFFHIYIYYIFLCVFFIAFFFFLRICVFFQRVAFVYIFLFRGRRVKGASNKAVAILYSQLKAGHVMENQIMQMRCSGWGLLWLCYFHCAFFYIYLFCVGFIIKAVFVTVCKTRYGGMILRG